MTKVFLSYARKDIAQAKRLYRALVKIPGLRVWFDQKDLLPGVRWKPAIRKAIGDSDFFIAVLSDNAVSQKGFRHTELREALDVWATFPEDKIFILPARLDDCPMPFSELEEINYADLFRNWSSAVKQLVAAMGIPSTGSASPASTSERVDTQPVAVSTLDYEYRVGIADLDVGLGNLRALTQDLNTIQRYFRFAEVTLHIPDSAVIELDGFSQLNINDIPPAFYRDPDLVNVDYVFCLTNHYLSFEIDDDIYYNYLGAPSRHDYRYMYSSTGGLYAHAREAGVKFEVAVVYVLVSQLVSYFFECGYHRDLRKCPMDYTEDHATMVPGIKKGKFCGPCKKVLSQNSKIRDAVQALLQWGR